MTPEAEITPSKGTPFAKGSRAISLEDRARVGSSKLKGLDATSLVGNVHCVEGILPLK